MEENNDKNNIESKEQNSYQDTSGKDALASIIYLIVAFVVMFILSKFIGN